MPTSAGADELLLLAVLLATDEGALELSVDELEGSEAALELGSAELEALETDASAEETLDDEVLDKEALDKEDGCEPSADEMLEDSDCTLEAWLLISAELVLCAEVEAGEWLLEDSLALDGVGVMPPPAWLLLEDGVGSLAELVLEAGGCSLLDALWGSEDELGIEAGADDSDAGCDDSEAGLDSDDVVCAWLDGVGSALPPPPPPQAARLAMVPANKKWAIGSLFLNMLQVLSLSAANHGNTRIGLYLPVCAGFLWLALHLPCYRAATFHLLIRFSAMALAMLQFVTGF